MISILVLYFLGFGESTGKYIITTQRNIGFCGEVSNAIYECGSKDLEIVYRSNVFSKRCVCLYAYVLICVLEKVDNSIAWKNLEMG